MKRKSIKISDLDLIKAYYYELIEYDNLNPKDQRRISSYEESIKELVPEEHLTYIANLFGIDNILREDSIEILAKDYKIDKDIIKIRLIMMKKELVKQQKREKER